MAEPAPSPAIKRFEDLLAMGRDNALLRFTLGNEYLKAGDAERAIVHLRRALELDLGYSAAWKLLGKSLAAAGHVDEALAAYAEGIAIAQAKGDKQAVKEMQVFARRIAKDQGRE
jgi:predicted Zn-dependent protease